MKIEKTQRSALGTFWNSSAMALGVTYALHSTDVMSLMHASVIVFVLLNIITLVPMFIIRVKTRKPLPWRTFVSGFLGSLATLCCIGIGEALRAGMSFEARSLWILFALAAFSVLGFFAFYQEAARHVAE